MNAVKTTVAALVLGAANLASAQTSAPTHASKPAAAQPAQPAA